MKILEVGYDYRHSAEFSLYRPFGSGDYLLLVLRSPAFFTLNEKKVEAMPNSVILFNKGTPQNYAANSLEFVNDWVHFDLNEEEAKQILAYGIEFDRLYPFSEVATFSKLIRKMMLEKHSQNTHRESSMLLYFRLLLNKLSDRMQLSESKQESERYLTFCALREEIYLTPNDDWSIQSICKKMCFSRSYIQHLYKKFFGESITETVTNGRMEYAKQLLFQTQETVFAISKECGYESEVHFMRTFKRYFGITPSQFRANKNSPKS